MDSPSLDSVLTGHACWGKNSLIACLPYLSTGQLRGYCRGTAESLPGKALLR